MRLGTVALIAIAIATYYQAEAHTCYSGITLGNGTAYGRPADCDYDYCAKISGQVKGSTVSIYYCSTQSVNNSTLGFTLDSCKISEKGDNCMPGPFTNKTQPNNDPRIVCYEAIHFNNDPIAANSNVYRTCHGDCVSFQVRDDQNNNVTVYTCDPTSTVSSLHVRNGCKEVNGIDGVNVCSCDSDECIDPTKNRSPDRKLKCTVGIYSKNNDKYYVNRTTEVECDGYCSYVAGLINNYETYAFMCTPRKICNSLGLDNSENTWQEINVKCCDNEDNCASKGLVVSGDKPRIEEHKVCYSGIFNNGAAISDGGWGVCAGDCVALHMKPTFKNMSIEASVYTCDPSTICRGLKMLNTCVHVDGLTACCCDSDECLDPTRNKTQPVPPLNCYVGLESQGISKGVAMNCNGRCAAISSSGNTVYGCVPKTVCETVGAYDDTVPFGNANVTCCDNQDFCNKPGSNETAPIPSVAVPISCYSGVGYNGQIVSGKWVSCRGECVSMSLNQNISLYTCDPMSLFNSLGIFNTCKSVGGISACGCSSNACIDPTVNPPKKPGTLFCYAGVNFGNLTYKSTGAIIECDGMCSTITGTFNNNNVTTYQCVPSSVCRALNLYDDYVKLVDGLDMSCCNDIDNCNNIHTPSVRPKRVDFPIVCYSGLFLNNKQVTPVSMGVCDGECAKIEINVTDSSALTLYGCEPSGACQSLGLKNSCNRVKGAAVEGCCCSNDLCLDPSKNLTVPSGYRTCYNGIYYKGQAIGGEMACHGKCGTLTTTLNNDKVAVFTCVPPQVCHQLELYDECSPIGNTSINSCCCDNFDNCNVHQAGLDGKIDTHKARPVRDFPISCYSGLFKNNMRLASTGWQACDGECASIRVTSNNDNYTLYTCDAASTCWKMGLQNNCTSFEQGLESCCCSTDACIDPTVQPERRPDDSLKCYVGYTSHTANISIGGEVYCSGQCARLNGIIGNHNVTAYNCVDDLICKTLELDDKCRTLYNDRQVTACCCNNIDNCNVKDPSITPGPVDKPEFPVACYTGLEVNGKAYTPFKLSSCQGHCASMTIASNNNSATLYTCDPTRVCNSFNLTNGCHKIEDGVHACCCDDDACINPITKTFPGPKNCFVGYRTKTKTIGESTPCEGYCGSLKADGLQSYHCVPKSICTNNGLFNTWRRLPLDRQVDAMCCTDGNNCNAKDIKDIKYVDSSKDPIACLESLYVNGKVVGNQVYGTCFGQCSSISYNTQANGVNNTLTLYTCSPAQVCSELGLNNGCAKQGEASGCCCDSDNCVGPNKVPHGSSSLISSTFALLFTTVVYFAF